MNIHKYYQTLKPAVLSCESMLLVKELKTYLSDLSIDITHLYTPADLEFDSSHLLYSHLSKTVHLQYGHMPDNTCITQHHAMNKHTYVGLRNSLSKT